MKYNFRISLRIRHPFIDTDIITRTIGLVPQNSWNNQSERTTPRGSKICGKNKSSFWTALVSSGTYPNQTLESDLSQILKDLSCYKEFISDLLIEGGEVELFIGWFTMANSGVILSTDIMSLAAKIGISISFDLYPPSQPQNSYPRQYNLIH